MSDEVLNFVGGEVYHEKAEVSPSTFLEWLIFIEAYVASGVAVYPLRPVLTAEETQEVLEEGVLSSSHSILDSLNKDKALLESTLLTLVSTMDNSTTLYSTLEHIGYILSSYSKSTELKGEVDNLLSAMSGESLLIEDIPIQKDRELGLERSQALSSDIAGSSTPYPPEFITDWVEVVTKGFRTTNSDLSTRALLVRESTPLLLQRQMTVTFQSMWADLDTRALPERNLLFLEELKLILIPRDFMEALFSNVYTLTSIINDFAQNSPIADRSIKEKLILINLDLRRAADTLLSVIEIKSISDHIESLGDFSEVHVSLDALESTLLLQTSDILALELEGDLTHETSLKIQMGVSVAVASTISTFSPTIGYMSAVDKSASYANKVKSDLRSVDPESKNALVEALSTLSLHLDRVSIDYQTLLNREGQTLTYLSNFKASIDSRPLSITSNQYWPRLDTVSTQVVDSHISLTRSFCGLASGLLSLGCFTGLITGFATSTSSLRTQSEILANSITSLDTSRTSSLLEMRSTFKRSVDRASRDNLLFSLSSNKAAVLLAFPDNPEVYGLLVESALSSHDHSSINVPGTLLDIVDATFSSNITSIEDCIALEVLSLLSPRPSACTFGADLGALQVFPGLNRRYLPFALRISSSKC